MSLAYAITNALTGLAASAFSWSSGLTTGRDRLNDGIQDELASGSASAQASGQTLTIDLGVATSLAAFALLNHNLGTGSCTVAVSAADNAGFSVGVVAPKAATTINTDFPYQLDTLLQFPAVSKRYWRLTFTHTGTKTITLGELLAFTSMTTLTRNAVYGASHNVRVVTNRSESDTGKMRSTFLSGPIRSWTFDFRDLRGEAERNELMNMWWATLGGVREILVADLVESSSTAATAQAQRCLWGKFSESFGWSDDDFSLFGVSGFTLVGQGRQVGA